MKKYILSLFLPVFMSIPSVAQSVGDQMYIYHNGRIVDGFLPSEIDSIAYSNYDNDSIWCDDVVTQIIYTPDSIYRIPLTDIDSISFVRPATIYKPGTVVLEGAIRKYITSSDGFNLVMDPNTPSDLMPKVGDRLVTMKPDESFPYYFAGEVRSTALEEGGIYLSCDTLEFEDVVEQFADIIYAGSPEDGANQAPDKVKSAKNGETPWIPIPLPKLEGSYELNAGLITHIDKMGDIEPGGKTGSGITYSWKPQARAKITWAIQGGLYVKAIMIMDNNISISHYVRGEFSLNYEKSFIGGPLQLPLGGIFGCYYDLGLFISGAGSLIIESGSDRKTRNTLVFIYDRAHPENNMARNDEIFYPTNKNPCKKLYGDVSVEAGLYARLGLTIARKELFYVGAKAKFGIEGEAHHLRLWEGITNASKSPDFYDNIKNGGLTYSGFVKINGEWGILEPLSPKFASEFLEGKTEVGKSYSFYVVPTFDEVKAKRIEKHSTTVSAQANLGQQVLLPVDVGFSAVNSNGDRVSTEYLDQSYSLINQIPTASVNLKNVPINGKYHVYPMLKMFGFEVMASPSVELKSNLPVKITNFKQTGSHYKEDGYTYDGWTYSYKYDVTVTVELDNSDGVADWGYVYEDPNGKIARISLKGFSSPYPDDRYIYYRNENPSTVRLYEYVKYEGSEEYEYGEPVDYVVQMAYHSCPDDNHPHMIDLGLPSGTKWACCNVGATKPEEYGGYYAWGETEEKNYKNFDEWWNIEVGYEIAGTEYDVAHVKWGSPWQMPSIDQIKEMGENSTQTWTTQNGVNGMLVTGPNGGSIFLPAGGMWYSEFYYEGNSGRFWSSSLSYNASGIGVAFGLGFDWTGFSWNYWDYCERGYLVRPICK